MRDRRDLGQAMRISCREVSPRRHRWSALWAVLVLLVPLWLRAEPNINQPNAHAPADFPVNLEFSIDDLTFSPSIQLRNITLRCERLAVADKHVRCARAKLVVGHSPFGRITLDVQIDLDRGSGRLVVEGNGGLGTAKLEFDVDKTHAAMQVVVDLDGFELSLLDNVLALQSPVVAEHDIQTGTLSLRAKCRAAGTGRTTCNMTGKIANLNLNGVNVAENVAMEFTAVYFSTASGADLEFSLSMDAGAAYIEPGFTLGGIKPGFYLEVQDGPIDLSARIIRLASGEVRIVNVNFSHPGIVAMRLSGDLALAPSPGWGQLDFALDTPDLSRLYATYLQPVVLDTVFGSLEIAGAVHLAVTGSADQFDNFVLGFDDVTFDDEAGRFSLYGFDGEIVLHAGHDLRKSNISWTGASLYQIQMGPGRIDWVSNDRNIKIASWRDVAIFDGEFHMDALELVDFGSPQMSVSLSGTLRPITLSAVTSAFGWTPMSGKLSGTIPRLTYSANRLEMDGDLEVKVFDGRIVIGQLRIDELLSTVPVLSANIRLEQLDLEALSHTFSFGNITGRLDGEITDLVLQAWQPIEFDASFATPIGDDTPHRISQQAVNNLGRLGAGTATGLAQGWLGLVANYSYGRLGIGCRLISGHCLMSGVENAPDGNFYILTRGGLLPPWIDVKGSGRRIKWQTLVDGIKQIARGKWELNFGEGQR